MRCRFVLITAIEIVGVLIVVPKLCAQVSNAGHAPDTPAPQVKPGTWRGVGTVPPCVRPGGGIYAGPPAPTTVAIRAGRMFDTLTGQMLTKQVVLIQGQRITEVGLPGPEVVAALSLVIDLSQATVLPGFIDAHNHELFVLGADAPLVFRPGPLKRLRDALVNGFT